MKSGRKFFAAFCLCAVLAAGAFAGSPFDVHDGVFGPEIKGFQLGMTMTPAEAADAGAGVADDFGALERVMEKGMMESESIFVILNDKNRVSSFLFPASAFDAKDLSLKEFVDAMRNAYLPGLEFEERRGGNLYVGKNFAEGWEARIMNHPVSGILIFISSRNVREK